MDNQLLTKSEHRDFLCVQKTVNIHMPILHDLTFTVVLSPDVVFLEILEDCEYK